MNSVTHLSDSDPYPELLSIGSKLLESIEVSMLKLFSIPENPEAFGFAILEVLMSSSGSLSSAPAYILASNTGTASMAMVKLRNSEIMLLILFIAF